MGKIPILRISIILEKGNKALICLLVSSFFASKILRVFNLNFIEKVSRKKFWHSTDAENNSSFCFFCFSAKKIFHYIWRKPHQSFLQVAKVKSCLQNTLN